MNHFLFYSVYILNKNVCEPCRYSSVPICLDNMTSCSIRFEMQQECLLINKITNIDDKSEEKYVLNEIYYLLYTLSELLQSFISYGCLLHLLNVLTDHFSNSLSEKTTNDIPLIAFLSVAATKSWSLLKNHSFETKSYLHVLPHVHRVH